MCSLSLRLVVLFLLLGFVFCFVYKMCFWYNVAKAYYINLKAVKFEKCWGVEIICLNISTGKWIFTHTDSLMKYLNITNMLPGIIV